MAWFKRKDNNIQTATPKEMPEGVWIKVPTTGEMIHKRELEHHLYVDPVSDYHFKIGSKEYFDILFDGDFTELGSGYPQRIHWLLPIVRNTKID